MGLRELPRGREKGKWIWLGWESSCREGWGRRREVVGGNDEGREEERESSNGMVKRLGEENGCVGGGDVYLDMVTVTDGGGEEVGGEVWGDGGYGNEGDRGVTKCSPSFLSEVLTHSEAEMTKCHMEYGEDNNML
ncbi:hypothetical protein ACH5RR_023161 [Cinchona calisaya]|uniref:Uncharacterized protein n=1 Tax=Cinchona calisaya TaxID=153742 RepID=A0ABD2ZAZ3_9GENT